jgi:hypothetical protein
MHESSGVTIYPRNLDLIIRVQQDATQGRYEVKYLGETETFVNRLLEPFLENHILRRALRNLWKAYQYNQEYVSFLLGKCSQDEFLKKAREYVTSFDKVNADQLSYAASTILDTVEYPLSSAELSVFLNVDHSEIDNADLKLIESDLENHDLNR